VPSVGKLVASILVAFVVVYVAIAVSPLPTRIARHNPQLASYFRAPSFNFDETYAAGNVLGFTVGAGRDSFIATLLKHYRGTAELDAQCGRAPGEPTLTVGESFVAVGDDVRTQPLLARNVVCISIRRLRAVLIVNFLHDKIRTIQLTIVNNEGT
jgi:hypothetical protein